MRSTVATLLATLTLAGCASRQGEDAAPVPMGAVQYDGQFRPTEQYSGRLGMSTNQRIFGSVRVIYREADRRAAISVMLTTSLQNPEFLSWAIVPGRCGSGGVPVVPPTQFPPLEIGTNGRGEVTAPDMQLDLPTATYHVNVYRGGETLTDVIACANLTSRR